MKRRNKSLVGGGGGDLKLATVSSVCTYQCLEKTREKVKPFIPTQGIDMLIKDEELDENQKKRTKRKKQEKDRGTYGETPNPIPGSCCTHRRGRAVAERKTEENKKKEIGSESPTQLPWTIQSPPTMRRDHTVSLFF